MMRLDPAARTVLRQLRARDKTEAARDLEHLTEADVERALKTLLAAGYLRVVTSTGLIAVEPRRSA